MTNHAKRLAGTPTASRVISDLALVLNQGLDVREVQALVVEKAVAALGASAGSVMMPGDEPGAMSVLAAIGLSNSQWHNPPESPVARWVVENDEPLLLIGRTGPLAHLLHREDIRDAVCVPLRYAGRAIGALSVSNSADRGPFDEGDVALLTAIGHLAAVAMRNTMLYNEASEHRERLQTVLRRLWTAQEDERRSLAADLHDGPAQTLFNIVFRLQTARRLVETDHAQALTGLAQAEEAARDTLRQIRAIMAGLRPMSLDDLGLVPALRNEADAVNSRGRVHVDVDVAGETRRLDVELETGLFRIVRELLSNVERHSGSERAAVEIRFDPDALTMCVQDWGRGLDEGAAQAARMDGRIGLAAARERADSLGVSISVQSRTDGGTRVMVRRPWPALAGTIGRSGEQDFEQPD
ncbi:MAG TPA: GAF domain-containing sensor histidine kinase [Armatimonadota bacterium]|jgi:signal transduction histidine kinase